MLYNQHKLNNALRLIKYKNVFISQCPVHEMSKNTPAQFMKWAETCPVHELCNDVAHFMNWAKSCPVHELCNYTICA